MKSKKQYILAEEERFESIERQILHMSYALEDLSLQMRKINETIKKLGEQLDEVKKNQQPIIINPSPVWPTNIPTEPYWKDLLMWTYTTTTETTKTGDAK